MPDMQFMQLGSKKSRRSHVWTFPIKTVHELNNTAMNERMLEIKALNLILSLLYMLIFSLVKPLHIPVHSAVDD